ncbi:Transmembrane protein 185A-like [Homarus americanus]|uniref:Transmembrane protein 185A-like n=1 Tax=Homarus americanus TaxID=6706 RepID=A0A8J5T8Y8_HOMAM|nr:Transmembrane protein 185A-like [Homarus americanus]
MNLQSMFRDFNPGKFIVWVCLATFTALLALRLDNELDWNFWVVFSPIWVWKALVVVGALIGNIVWWKNPHYRCTNLHSSYCTVPVQLIISS